MFDCPQWLTPKWRSQNYVEKIKKELEDRGCQIRTNSEIFSVLTNDEGCTVTTKDGLEEVYDGCIIAAHAPDALKMLGNQVTYDEQRILGAFQYGDCDVILHHDKTLMPKSPSVWSLRNFLTIDKSAYVTYWLNVAQNTGDTELPFFLSLNPPRTPERILLRWSTSHLIPSVAASKASSEINLIQGKRRIWFCGAYQGYGFHEDGLKAGILAANSFLMKESYIKSNPKHMVLSWSETGARLLVTRFFEGFIATGCLTLLEEGGTVFNFKGTRKENSLKVYLRIHTPQFYWKVATEADVGLADAYINGDFSFIDKKQGLFNLFMLLIANTELSNSAAKFNNKMGWFRPLFFTSAMAKTKYYLKHILRKNTLAQARRNISQHYDLSNELFSLFLDETMVYSCAKFKTENEDLKKAQLRKVQMLIDKAKISKDNHILEIGCGWGTLAFEAVKQTGCKYTGITLSEKQLQYAELKVKEAGLQDQVIGLVEGTSHYKVADSGSNPCWERFPLYVPDAPRKGLDPWETKKIKFLLCDYRQLPKTTKYDRIISCEMLEAVGHEYFEDFFRCCDSALAENGILVLQFISIADEQYDELTRSSGFLREYIFPGGCVPSLNRVTSAMAAASRLSVVHLEEIGIHYYLTLKIWRENLLRNQNKIRALGFDENFIRTWEYYFDYCAAGFKSNTLGNYQVVFTRPSDVAVFGELYQGVPSAY